MTAANKRLIYSIFALSGACALVYEILWTKYLSLILGNTISAVSIVAATFMGGLAIGSYLLGRYIDRQANFIVVYAWLEIGIAVTALLFPFALDVVEQLYIFWRQLLPDNPLLVGFTNTLFCSALILPPTICMGGTFPLMCRFFARSKSGGQIGRLYALNTLGATIGAFCCGFILLPNLGLSQTGYLAAFCNFLVAGIAFWAARQYGSGDASGSRAPSDEQSTAVHLKFRPILIATALVGFFSLAYEILWTRILLLFLGNTSYAFSLMLSAYLIGIALGGWLYARLVHPRMHEKTLFLALAALMAITVLVSAPFYDKLAYLFQFAHEVSGERWWYLTLFSFLIVFVVISLPTILSGALLPAAVAILDPGRSRTGEGVGIVVLFNTVGAVLGSLAAGFLLVPWIGLLQSFKVLATINLTLVAFLVIYYARTILPNRLLLGLIGCGMLFVSFPSAWDPLLINSGIYCYASKYTKMGGLDSVLGQEKILEVIEGNETTVAVHEDHAGKHRFFTVNGKTDGGTGSDMSTQILIGQLPLLLHPEPDEVLVIGLGTGITLNAMSDHPTKRITCVEISPEVVAAEAFFTQANGFALHDPKVDLVVNDGRNLLLTDPRFYDVIISEPSNPWQTGNANLFTDDFYKLAASRLKEQGIFCQWIGLYDITLDNLKIACRTFLNSFNRVLAFQAGSDLILVGANHDLNFDFRQLQNRFTNPAIDNIMKIVGIDTPGDLIAARYLFDEETLINFSRDADTLNTDDRPILEFSARYNLGEKTLGEYASQNAHALMQARSGKHYLPITNFGRSDAEVASSLRQIGSGYAKAGRRADAATFMRRAAELN